MKTLCAGVGRWPVYVGRYIRRVVCPVCGRSAIPGQELARHVPFSLLERAG